MPEENIGGNPLSGHFGLSLSSDTVADQRWRLLFEQSPLSIQIFNPSGQTIRFNRAWSQLFGLSDEEAYAFNVLQDPNLEQAGALELIRRAFAGEVVFVPPLQFPVRHDPTQMRWIGGTLYPVITPDGVLREVVVIHHDITELKEAEATLRYLNVILEARVAERTAELRASEEELRKALDVERELNVLKSRFVDMVSHEFRTPLGIIQSATELLQRHHDKLGPEQRARQTHSILNAVKRMADMMEDILLLGRMDSERHLPRCTMIDLPEWFRQNLDALCPDHEDQARIELVVCDRLKLESVLLDELLLLHVLANLISNACKYSPRESKINVTLQAGDSGLCISIQDHGIGIADEEQTRLFEDFYRASNVGNRPGSGLGLTIAHRCAQRMDARLELDSKLGEGTTFRLHVPLVKEVAI